METLSYYTPGTWVYTLNDDSIEIVIITSITISIDMNNIQRIVYDCHFNTNRKDGILTKTHDKVFLTKEDLIKSLLISDRAKDSDTHNI